MIHKNIHVGRSYKGRQKDETSFLVLHCITVLYKVVCYKRPIICSTAMYSIDLLVRPYLMSYAATQLASQSQVSLQQFSERTSE